MLLLLAAALPCAAQQGPAASTAIYSCVDASGRRLTSDRPIAECTTREQRLLNRDGSLRAIIPPTLTAEERAEKEARLRAAEAARVAQADAVRRDRNLLARYPNEASHNRAREAALDTARAAAKSSEERLRGLTAERKPLLDEAEFYQGKPLPAKLRSALDANDAAVEAQRAAMVNQQAEMARINAFYDAELERLRRLWSGAPAGSLGPLPVTSSVRGPK
ncbi:MAG: hypothetical protein KGN16_12640 [Burkholderiales bacterium]|nr:hypothetical protein [Burkholderiales bacterium]